MNNKKYTVFFDIKRGYTLKFLILYDGNIIQQDEQRIFIYSSDIINIINEAFKILKKMPEPYLKEWQYNYITNIKIFIDKEVLFDSNTINVQIKTLLKENFPESIKH